MTEESSALYPPGNASSVVPTAWFSTLRNVLEQLGAQARAQAARVQRSEADTDPAETIGLSATSTLHEPREESESTALAERLRAVSREAADVPQDLLLDLLTRHRRQISILADAFGLDAPTVLVALGRGLLPGELDPTVAEAVSAGVAELRGVISSGSVTVERDGRTTTLIAATTVGEPAGPVRLTDGHWELQGRSDVWLCAVAPGPDPIATAQALFERILPQAGVLRAHLRTSERRRLHVGLQAVAPTADPDLVMGRLEGWRAAVGQLASGLVDIVWEQA